MFFISFFSGAFGLDRGYLGKSLKGEVYFLMLLDEMTLIFS